jgi:PST family polysaccharide transporter
LTDISASRTAADATDGRSRPKVTLTQGHEWLGKIQKGSARQAGAWSFLSSIINTGGQVASAVILARMLSPEQFGVFAIATALYAFPSQLIGPSLIAATVQHAELSQQQASNMFWACSAIYAAVALAFAAGGPLVGTFYREPVLSQFMVVYALILVLDGTTVLHRALLSRAMRFDVLAKAAFVIAPTAVAVGVASAWAGAGAWSLAAQLLVTVILERIVLLSVVRWRPGPFRKGSGFRSMLHFSGKSALGMALHLVYSQSQTIVLGRAASVADVGIYSRGQGLFLRPLLQIFIPIQSVLLPLFSERRNDPETLGLAVQKSTAVLLALIAPLTAWMIAAGPDIAETLLGAQWRVVGNTLRLFAIGATPWLWLSPLGKVNESLGHPSRASSIRIVLLPMLVIGLMWAAPRGAVYAAGLYAAIEWASIPLGFWLLTRDMPLRLGYFLRPMFEFAGVTVVLTAALVFLTIACHDRGAGAFISSSLTFCSAYILGGIIAACLPFGRLAIREFIHITRQVSSLRGAS